MNDIFQFQFCQLTKSIERDLLAKHEINVDKTIYGCRNCGELIKAMLIALKKEEKK